MNILEMNHVSKTFGSSRVLSDIHLSVGEGEIHALLGENGAGKSTLMNILTGVIPADAGEIVFCGKSYPTPTIHQMEAAGIAFVHQELNVINDLTVADNIFLRRELTRFGLPNNKEQVAKTKQLFEELGADIDPNAMVSELKTSEKQLLEICRALYADAKLLILDEPTTALSNNEIDHLFDILRKLKTQGKSFIFISHKMPEIFAVADRYTLLRNGEFISSGNIKDTDPHAITSDMVGIKYVDAEVYEPRELGGPLLTLHGLSGDGFENIDLTVRRGEIVALTGLAGCGASELSITSLSGGNQQKVFIAHWLNIGADVLLFDNPTQCVDVGAKAEIYKLMLSFAKEGKAVIFNTLEIPEIQKVADRCVVFYEGRIAKIFQHSEVNEHDVMLYSTNAVDTHVEVAR